MIGVIAKPSEYAAVREFFELFKTPWEFCITGRHYDVLLCADGASVQKTTATLTLVYGSQESPFDAEHKPVSCINRGIRMLLGTEMRIPVYGETATFAFSESAVLVDEFSREPAAYVTEDRNGRAFVRIGYDLFTEITTLLVEGQPSTHASIPTLDLHISLLRNLIVNQGVPLIEIPPVPEGYRFIACLTHDVDHPAIRRHRFDHTMFGFLYRALIGSVINTVRRRMSLRTLGANWLAALKLPFVYLGLAEDFWSGLDAYANCDQGCPSTFFVIPFQGRPGTKEGARAPSLRASGYGAAHIASKLRQLLSSGHEIGLHGIDAWHSPAQCGEELAEIRRISGVQQIGARMHWLYFDRNSPSVLETAGVAYDSTVGYNEAIGYRAGTAQVYKPLGVTRLLELPLHIMDTALFSPGRQHLSPSGASILVQDIIDNAARFGGVITINWHDRSIAPERMWRDFYVSFVCELRKRGAWLANASDTVQWFRQRRSAELPFIDQLSGAEPVIACASAEKAIPGLCVRFHNDPSQRRAEQASLHG